MYLTLDVQYKNDTATVAGVTFDSPTSSNESEIFISKVDNIAPYESGYFYKRELPCLLTLIREHHLSPSLIIIDGFVHFGHIEKMGLGMHLYNSLERKIPIIGVAKNPFKNTPKEAEIFRPSSKTPLYITSVGYPIDDAKQFVLSMHGKYRIPTMLKLVDSAARGLIHESR